MRDKNGTNVRLWSQIPSVVAITSQNNNSFMLTLNSSSQGSNLFIILHPLRIGFSLQNQRAFFLYECIDYGAPSLATDAVP